MCVQFHRDPVSAVDSCYQGDTVIVLPGIYSVRNSIFLPDSITVEGEEHDLRVVFFLFSLRLTSPVGDIKLLSMNYAQKLLKSWVLFIFSSQNE